MTHAQRRAAQEARIAAGRAGRGRGGSSRTSAQNSVSNIVSAMAGLAARATQAANAQRLQIARGNIAAGEAQLEREETVQRRAIARSLDQHLGAAAASASFRGAGGRSAEQGAYAASLQAADEAAVVAGNRAANSAALAAHFQVMLDDPYLSAIQGGMEGYQLGNQIAASLANQSEVIRTQTSVNVGPFGGASETAQTVFTPGFDLSQLFDLYVGGF